MTVAGDQELRGDDFPIPLISQKIDQARIVDVELTDVTESVLRSKTLMNGERYI